MDQTASHGCLKSANRQFVLAVLQQQSQHESSHRHIESGKEKSHSVDCFKELPKWQGTLQHASVNTIHTANTAYYEVQVYMECKYN